MARSTDYALRPTLLARTSVFEVARDTIGGALVTLKLIVAAAGCATLLAFAFVMVNESVRQRIQVLTPLAVAAWLGEQASEVVEAVDEATAPATAAPATKVATDPQQSNLVSYLARRYRVADDAVRQIVAQAFTVGREKQVDPLLILAVTAIESSLNPLAQSPVGAQGLMQVMTRVHTEKFDAHGGEAAALDPMANIEVGSRILSDLIARGGSVERGLQLYVGAGNLPDDGGYGARVLAERSRLQMAAQGKVAAAMARARSGLPGPEFKVTPASVTGAAVNFTTQRGPDSV
ncbi:MAG: lytic transglycosylase domain-containing protein [Burkholderiaceae bacterium]